MLRSFDWRAIEVVYRLRKRAVYLDSDLAFTQDVHPMRSTLQGYLPDRSYPTFVWVGEESQAAFLQLHISEDESPLPVARVRLVAPDQPTPTEAWSELLDGALAAAVEHSCQQLVLEVPAESEWVSFLLKMGFSRVTSLTVLQAPTHRVSPSPVCPESLVESPSWHDVFALYSRILPPIQKMELPPSMESVRAGWGWRDSERLVGFCGVIRGARGWMLKPLVDEPYARQMTCWLASQIVSADVPIFASIRPHQPALLESFLRAGWGEVAEWVVFARRLVVAAASPLEARVGQRLLTRTAPLPTPFLRE